MFLVPRPHPLDNQLALINTGNQMIRLVSFWDFPSNLMLSFTILAVTQVAWVASVPVRAKCHVSRASEDSGRRFWERRGEWGGGGGSSLSPQFSHDQNLRSCATHNTSLARERLLPRLSLKKTACYAGFG